MQHFATDTWPKQTPRSAGSSSSPERQEWPLLPGRPSNIRFSSNRGGDSMKTFLAATAAALAALALVVGVAAATPNGADTLVTVGSPPTPFPQNKQNEPAAVVNPADPTIAAAGANEEVDLEACNNRADQTCPFTAGVGTSGIYFSDDGGSSWMQPTYTGWTARDCLGLVGTSSAPADNCDPHVGPIGTLPRYFESGLVSDGDPAVGFGPQPAANGTFSWSNGWRLYYANLTSNFSAARSETTFKGFEAIAVSRLDSQNYAAAKAGDNAAWKAPVIVTKQNAALFSDHEMVAVDDASSSPFFGNVYTCNAAFRSQQASGPEPIVVNSSSDAGDTDQIVLAWSNGPTPSDTHPGPNEQVRIVWSRNQGRTWTSASVASPASDRPDFPAIAISPDGGDAYLTYMDFLQPWQSTTASPRLFEGVVRHADVDRTTGAIGAWSDVHRAPTGDARGSSANALTGEFLGDYDYAFATNDFVVAVWNDARNAADCPAIDAYRQDVVNGTAAGTSTDPTRPAPNNDCPATFGNTDIFGGSYADPTP